MAEDTVVGEESIQSKFNPASHAWGGRLNPTKFEKLEIKDHKFHEGVFTHVDKIVDYTLSNPDTLTKYKTAAQISHRVLETVKGIDSTQPCATGNHTKKLPRMVQRG